MVNTRLETLPPQVVAGAKLHILDTLATTLAGCRTSAARIAANFTDGFGRGDQATVFFTGRKAPVLAAALANGVAACVLDYDDGHMGSGYHPGAVIVPASLAVAEWQGSSGQELLEAVVVGYEVGLRAALMIRRTNQGATRSNTGAMGGYGGAAAAAKLLKLNAEQTAQALGIGSCIYPISTGGGMPIFGAMVKENIGWGGMTGVAAALLARKGYTGGFSLLNTRVDGTERHPFYPFDGVTWEILKTYFKPYPACRFCHAPLDALFRLMKEHGLKATDVSQVMVEAGLNASGLNTRRPLSVEHAQYSIPFTIGAALAYGKAGPDEVSEEKLRDPAILQQAEKVRVKSHPEMEALYPRRYAATVHLRTAAGQQYSLRKETALGDFDEPVSPDWVKEKFISCAVPVIGEGNARRALALVEGLERVPSVGELIERLRGKVPVG